MLIGIYAYTRFGKAKSFAQPGACFQVYRSGFQVLVWLLLSDYLPFVWFLVTVTAFAIHIAVAVCCSCSWSVLYPVARSDGLAVWSWSPVPGLVLPLLYIYIQT